MTDNTVNGWRNWETWKVALHWNDYFSELASDGVNVTEEMIQDEVMSFIDEALEMLPDNMRLFICDLLPSSGEIHWHELAAHHERSFDDA